MKINYYMPKSTDSGVARHILIGILRATCVSLLFIAAPSSADIYSAIAAYEQGDFDIAYREFSQLADEGNTEAQYNLAFMYYGGEGVDEDYGKAFRWFMTAAKSGHAMAQDLLAHMYNHGYGTKKDVLRAYVWYSLAAVNGVFISSVVRDGLESELGRAQRAQADLMIREYMKEISTTSTK